MMPHLVWLYGGSLNNTLDAATWLDVTNELRKLGWQVTLVAAGPSGRQFIRGIEVFCISRPEKYLLRQIVYHMRFLGFLQKQMKNVDSILFHPMSAPWLLPVRLMRGFAGRRRPLLVMDIRSLHMPLQNKQGWKGQLREMFLEYINRSANHWTDGFLTITRRMAEAANIPLHKLWGEWPSGVNTDLFAPAKAARCWPSPEQPVQLVYIGALHHERNLMTLCRAVAHANAEGMSFALSLVGDGTERGELEDFATQTNGQVRVDSPVPYEQIPEVLARAHIGVLPFPDEEKFRVSSPIKLFEYMAAGLPILATRIVCHTDVVGPGNYAFWAQDAGEQGLLDSLRVVWQSRDLLSEMGRQAALAAEGWTWAASAKKLKKGLEKGFLSLVSSMGNNQV